MDVQGLFITRTKTEVLSGLLAVVSLVMSVASAVGARETRPAALSALVLLFLIALGWFVILVTRPAFTIRGYNDVMFFLIRLTRTSRYKLWTVRSHTGQGHSEDPYFHAIEDRLRNHTNPLEDFRRVIRMNANASEGLKSLISRFYRQNNVSVYYYSNCGPKFDFMIVDGRIGVIGFPMADGEGNVGAVVLRRRAAVEGLESIFNELCRESELLFKGDARHEPQVAVKLLRKLTEIS